MKYTIDDLIKKYPILENCKQSILDAYKILEDCYKNGNKLLIAGNGGSCSDSEHIVGELMKGFKSKRELNPDFKEKLCSIDPIIGKELSNKLQGAFPAIALDGHQSLNTAFTNDIENGGLLTFAQQIVGYGIKNDVFLAITTSGNSINIINACVVAKAKGLKIIGLTGKDGGRLKDYGNGRNVLPRTRDLLS